MNLEFYELEDGCVVSDGVEGMFLKKICFDLKEHKIVIETKEFKRVLDMVYDQYSYTDSLIDEGVRRLVFQNHDLSLSIDYSEELLSIHIECLNGKDEFDFHAYVNKGLFVRLNDINDFDLLKGMRALLATF